MPIKYTREDFRDQARGTPRFGRYQNQRRRGPVLFRGTGAILLTLPIIIFILLFTPRLAEIIQSGMAHDQADAVVMRKELRQEAGEPLFVITVEVVFEDEDPVTGPIAAPRGVWEAVEVGDAVVVSYREIDDGAAIEILDIQHPVPQTPNEDPNAALE